MNPFRQFQQEFRAARYLKQAEALEVQGKVWLTQAELWDQQSDTDGTLIIVARARARGKHLLGWADTLRVEASMLRIWGDQ